ncbi:MAG: MATE family efflux transporter [Clostridia bacterium]|nr:MATE family efflux transporter [Clostridia bacterium]
MLKQLFGGKRYWSLVFSLAVPIAIQNLLTSSFVLIDTLMISSLGDVSLASVGMAGQWSWLLNLTLFGFSSGASVFFSQYYGDKNLAGIKKTYGIVMLFLSISVTVFTILGFLIPKPIISIFNRDAAVLEIGATYLKIAVFSYPAIALNQIVGVLLRSTGRAKLPMYVAALTAVLNAALDYALIFGKFGCPQLGIEGAAIATCISAWVGPIVLMSVLIYQKDDIVCAPIRELLSFTKEDVRLFFNRALPVLINEVLWGLGTFALNVVYSNMGYEYYAAMTILKTFENIAFAFFVGLDNACCIMVGQEIGGGEIKMGLKDARRFLVLVPTVSALTAIAVVLFKNELISIFNMAGTITKTTLDTASKIVIVYAVTMPSRNLLYVIITGVFRSGGDTKTGMRYDLCCLWGIAVPVAVLSAFVLRLPFVLVYALSIIFEDTPKFILCLRHFLSKKLIIPVNETVKNALNEYRKEKGIKNL